MPTPLEILLPVHNEAGGIRDTIREIHEVIHPQAPFQFLICEDGSTDGTPAILADLAQTLPIRLLPGIQRRGYSQAVLAGMRALTSPYLLCLDADGQCDPADFGRFWEQRDRADILIGSRVHRADSALRKVLSRLFYHIYQLFFHTPADDPSCPFLLVRKQVVDRLLPELGVMQQGIWWEFLARAHRRGFSIRQLSVHHRRRRSGQTRIYQLRRLPGIGYRQLAALFTIWRETRA